MGYYRYIRILSLDVVAGACISSLFIARVLSVDLPWSVVFSLGLAVWIIYTMDHMIDGMNISHEAGSLRHHFHQKYSGIMAVFTLIALGLSAINLFFIPAITLKLGMLLLILVAMYFVILQVFRTRNIFIKELTIAFIYSAGLFIGPVSLAQDKMEFIMLPLFVQFFGLSLTNLLLFSILERDLDQRDGHSSIAIYLGVEKVRKIGLLVIFIVLLLSVLSMSMGAVQLIISIMAIALGIMIYKPGIFRQGERYRIIGDAVFLIPLFLLG